MIPDERGYLAREANRRAADERRFSEAAVLPS